MFIVGSDAFLVTSMRIALRYASGINVLGVRDTEDSVTDAVREAEPDVVVIDSGSDPVRALDRLGEVRAARPEALVVFAASEPDTDLIAEAVNEGALVCVCTESLVPQLQALLAEPADRDSTAGYVGIAATNAAPTNGATEEPPVSLDHEPCPLTKRELEILRSVAEGHTNARIGRELWVTEQTVKFHLSKIYRKLGVANRTEASRYALLNDLFATRRAARWPAAIENGNGNGNGNGHTNGHVGVSQGVR
jgi:DNA-binding NarL/FixJ family response regulator